MKCLPTIKSLSSRRRIAAAQRVRFRHWRHVDIILVVDRRRISFRWFQQVVAITMGDNTMLTISEETTSSSQWFPAHFKQLNCWIRRKHKVLVCFHKHENDDESTTDNHPVGYHWNGSGSKYCSQIDPPSDWWCQLTDSLMVTKNIVDKCENYQMSL